MSLRDLPWGARGKLAFKDGLARSETPYPVGEPETIDWLKGYDEAAEESGDDARGPELADVQLVLADGRLRLTDRRGRVLGTQAHIAVEQGEDDMFNATVTFVGLKLVAS